MNNDTSALQFHSLDSAVFDALDAFWDKISEKYPQVQSGDFSPEEDEPFQGFAQAAVEYWLEANDPLAECCLDREHVAELSRAIDWLKTFAPDLLQHLQVWRAEDWWNQYDAGTDHEQQTGHKDAVMFYFKLPREHKGDSCWILYAGHLGAEDYYSQYPWHTLFGCAEPTGCFETVVCAAMEYMNWNEGT